MAADPNDNDLTKDDPAKRKDRPPQIWPESQDMVSQQTAANEMFKRHSEKLQEWQAAKHEVAAPKNQEPEKQEPDQPGPTGTDANRTHGRDFTELKVMAAEAVFHETEGEEHETQGKSGESGQQEIGSRPLAFVKDGELRYKRETEVQKQESGSKPEQEDAEPKPHEPNRKLLFVKDRGPDLSRG